MKDLQVGSRVKTSTKPSVYDTVSLPRNFFDSTATDDEMTSEEKAAKIGGKPATVTDIDPAGSRASIDLDPIDGKKLSLDCDPDVLERLEEAFEEEEKAEEASSV